MNPGEKPDIPAIFTNLNTQQIKEPSPLYTSFAIPPEEPQQDDEEAFQFASNIEFPPGDIEEFLRSSEMLFAFVELSWQEVKKATEHLQRITEDGFVPIEDPITNTIIFQKVTNTKALPKRGRRYLQSVFSDYATNTIRAVRMLTTPDNIQQISEFITNDRPSNVVQTVASLAIGEIENPPPKDNDEPTIVRPKEVEDAANSLRQSMLAAYGLQHLGIRYIEKMLEDDANVMPFVERLLETAALRSSGVEEFPGLFETLNVSIAQRNVQGTSALEAAILRVAPKHFTPEDFIVRALSENKNVLQGNISKDFFTMVSGAKLVAQSVVLQYGEVGVTEDAITALIASQITSKRNNPWKAAYLTDTETRAKQAYRQVVAAISLYDRKGRIPKQLQALGTTERSRRRTKAASRDVMAGSEIEDFTRDDALPKEPLKLGIMRNIRGSSQYSIEPVPDIMAIMEDPMVTKFLNKQHRSGGLRTALELYLNHLWENPVDYRTTKTLTTRRCTFAASDILKETSFKIRRFKPNGIISETGDELQRKIRIFYALLPKMLLIDSVVLRDDDTY